MIMDESELQFGELRYQTRLVSFFDTLGWCDQILEAGEDPRRIARLASVPRAFSNFVTSQMRRVDGAFITSFSDNVVVSVPLRENYIFTTIEAMARVQLGLAMAGFWVRGAITYGSLFHDDSIVFGPALNRAYELEHNYTIYPRALLDPKCELLNGITAAFIDVDESGSFTNPFNLKFIERALQMPCPEPNIVTRYNDVAGTSVSLDPQRLPPQILMASLLGRAEAEINAATSERVREKFIWLRSQIYRGLSSERPMD